MAVNIKQELKSVWSQIVEINSTMGFMNVGKTLQDALQDKIRPLLPPCIGYNFYFNMSGQTEHVFYEIGNENNRITLA